MELKRKNLSTYFDHAATLIVSSWLFLTFARFDPEPHHDGIQLASAIGISEGLRVHTEVFSQYGAVAPWLNGFWLSITSQSLLSLRVFGAIQLVGISVLMQLIMAGIELRRSIRNLVTIAWLAACPVWSYQKWFFSLWPWPSISYMLFLLSGVYVVMRMKNDEKSDSKRWLLSGFLLGIAALIRPNYGAVFFGAVGLFILAQARSSVTRRQIGQFILGMGSPTLGMFSVLFLQKSVRGWLNQSVLGPVSGKAVANIDFSYFYNIYFLNWKQLATCLIGFAIILTCRTKLNLFASVAFLGVLLLGLELFTQVELTNPLTWNMKYVLRDPLDDPLSAMATIRIGLLFGVLYILIFGTRMSYFAKTLNRACRDNRFILPVLVAAALSGVAQLYPLPDVYHLWWASPPILIICAMALNQVNPRAVNLVIAFFLPAILMSFSRLDEQLNIRRLEWHGGVLDGMYIDAELNPSFERVGKLLGEVGPGTRFECRDGLWSVFNGRYNSIGPNFVNWAYGTPRHDNSADNSIVWCLDSGMTTDKNALKMREIITSGNQSLYFSRFSGDIQFELWKK